jgi:hypothetical protein
VSATARIEFALKVIATAIAAFGVWKYFADRSAAAAAEAKARSLGYIERFAGKDIVEARAELLQFWKSYPEFASVARQGDLTKREYANFVRAIYPAHPRRIELDQALFRMLTFYDEAAYCREAGLCDSEILDSFFCTHVTRHMRVYEPFYQRLSDEIGSRSLDQNLRRFGAGCEAGA